MSACTLAAGPLGSNGPFEVTDAPRFGTLTPNMAICGTLGLDDRACEGYRVFICFSYSFFCVSDKL